MFRVVNVYLDHLKFCVVCINSRRYVCCSEGDVVSNECNEPTSCLVFELLEFVSESVYVDLQYDEISLTSTAGPVCLCGVSSPVVVLGPVCEVVVAPYVVRAVVAVTVMPVLLFVFTYR